MLDRGIDKPSVSDWKALLLFAKKQALTGICLPLEHQENLSKGLLLHWIGEVEVIEGQNKLLNRRIEQLFDILEKEGFRCCLMKGQGNAELYPNPLRRCSGDIDVWIDSDEKTVYEYVRSLFPNEKKSYKHIHFPLFDDAPIDVHVSPLKFYSGLYGKRLQLWLEENKKEQFAHKIKLIETNRDISVPTRRFNAVYQLGHMLIHVFDEGLGLRQVVDYYYVLKGLELSSSEQAELVGSIQSLGMYRFAKGMMWIENTVLGLPSGSCLVEPDKRIGRKLLRDMIEGGNFGHYSARYKKGGGFYQAGLAETWRILTFLSIAPREGMSRVCHKMKTAVKHVGRKVTGRMACFGKK